MTSLVDANEEPVASDHSFELNVGAIQFLLSVAAGAIREETERKKLDVAMDVSSSVVGGICDDSSDGNHDDNEDDDEMGSSDDIDVDVDSSRDFNKKEKHALRTRNTPKRDDIGKIIFIYIILSCVC